MLATRIIPTLLCHGRLLVKGERFQSWRRVGVAAQAVRIFNQRNCDELALIDIGATPEKRGPDLTLIKELADTCFMPLAVGGGIRTINQVRDLLNAGADKIIIGQALWQDPYLAWKVARKYGSQVLIAAIDHSGGQVCHTAGSVVSSARIGPYCEILANMGAGEILLTSVEREGTMQGYDCEIHKRVSQRDISVPVIAHGGCGTYQHMVDVLKAGADAVAAGAMFQFEETTPAEAAAFLEKAGYETRPQSIAVDP